nr:hypothetical protein [uncultured bacterium]
MTLRPFFAFLMAALFVLPACDTAEEDRLTEADFVGIWDLVQVTDGSGDRSGEAFGLLDEFQLTFESGGSFELFVDLNDTINQDGTPDTTIPGVYSLSEAGQLILNVGAIAPAFTVDNGTANRLGLSTSAVIINTLLAGSGVDLDLTGTVTLIVAKN